MIATPSRASASESSRRIGQGPRAGFRWTRELILYSIDLWHRTHLEAPAQLDWERAGAEHPCKMTVLREFGTWNEAIRAAGLRPRARGYNKRWARRRCAKTGRWCKCAVPTESPACAGAVANVATARA